MTVQCSLTKDHRRWRSASKHDPLGSSAALGTASAVVSPYLHPPGNDRHAWRPPPFSTRIQQPPETPPWRGRPLWVGGEWGVLWKRKQVSHWIRTRKAITMHMVEHVLDKEISQRCTIIILVIVIWQVNVMTLVQSISAYWCLVTEKANCYPGLPMRNKNWNEKME